MKKTVLLGLLLVLCVTACTPQQESFDEPMVVLAASPTNGLLAYYDFEECSGNTLIDSYLSDGFDDNLTKNNEAGYITGSTPNGTGCAGTLDGVNDYWGSTDSSSEANLNAESGDSFTISFNANVSNYGGTSGRDIIYAEGNGGVHRYWIESLSNASNTTRVGQHGSGSSTISYTLPTDEWYHYAFVFNNTGNIYLIYYNGTNVFNVTGRNDDSNQSLVQLRIGDSQSDGVAWHVDNVRIYNTALGDDDVYAIYEEDFGLAAAPAENTCWDDNKGLYDLKHLSNGSYQFIGGTSCLFESSDIS